MSWLIKGYIIMQKSPSSSKRALVGSTLFVLLFLMTTLAACSAVTGGPATTGTVTLSRSKTPNGTPTIRSGAQPCPGDTGNPAYWQTIIGTVGGPQQVQSVSCANILG